MSIHFPKCPNCNGKYGGYTAFCNDINPVHEDCFYMQAGIKHTHVTCASPICKSQWVEFEGKLVKPLRLQMAKAELKQDRRNRKLKHG